MATAAEKKTEDWMTTKWRPLMAVTYMATIWFDFILGPIIYNFLQYYKTGQALSSWTPLTLQGGGLFHLSMGAILGIAAWTRGKEKIAAIENGTGGMQDMSMQNQSPWINQPTGMQNTAYSYNQQFGGMNTGMGSSTVTEYETVTQTPVDADRPKRRKI